MKITDWPSAEQPRNKLLQQGVASLSDAELLAIFLGSGTAKLSAVDLARQLLQSAGGLHSLLNTDQKKALKYKGIGPAKWCAIQAALELGRRSLEIRLRQQPVLENPASTARFVRSWLGAYEHEVFACLFLDNRHRLLIREEMFHGTIDGASVYPREVVKRALQHNAAAVIFAHNHPSGVAEPSSADRDITLALQQALALVDIRVLDHLVVGRNQCVSLAERGLLP